MLSFIFVVAETLWKSWVIAPVKFLVVKWQLLWNTYYGRLNTFKMNGFELSCILYHGSFSWPILMCCDPWNFKLVLPRYHHNWYLFVCRSMPHGVAIVNLWSLSTTNWEQHWRMSLQWSLPRWTARRMTTPVSRYVLVVGSCLLYVTLDCAFFPPFLLLIWTVMETILMFFSLFCCWCSFRPSPPFSSTRQERRLRIL